MTIVPVTELEGSVRPFLGVSGPVAGFDIHYDIEGPADVSSPTASITIKLNEKSLINAEKRSGVTRTPKTPGAKALASAGSITLRQDKNDERYASLFDNKGLTSAVNKGTQHKVGGGLFRSSTRTTMTPTLSPLMRNRHRRRLLKLRQTFDLIAAQKKKVVSVSSESLPQASLERMVQNAIRTGAKTTPVGSLERTMRLAGKTPKKRFQPQQKKPRPWALFFNPELIPSGWAMD